MKRFSIQTGVAAANYRQKKGLNLSEGFRQRRRKCSIVVKEALIAFLPSLRSSAPKLFAKIFANERMRIELSRIVQIFSSQKSCSS
jgi:hypothetical protein